MFLLLAALCSIVFNKMKLPPLIGYLMAGILIANFWTIDETSEAVVEVLSDMGLIVLMFCIGMEINLAKIRTQGTFAIIVALVQLPLMVLGGVVAGTLMGFDMVQSICLGGIISGSSTAVVMAVLKTQDRLDKDHIDTLVLITIMEDIGQVIILSMITPLMAGSELDSNSLIAMVICILVFMIISIIVGVRVMPEIINRVSKAVPHEVLLVLAIGLAFGMALLANFAGLSVAIGAFLMGMMISPSKDHEKLSHDFEPMKNLMMSMFFISVGMEIALQSLIDNILMIIGLYLLFAFLKSSTVFLGYWLGNESPRNGFVSAVGLVAMGEFAFIIAKQALDYGVVDEGFYTSVIGAALISMIMLPLLTKSSDRIWEKMTSGCPAPVMNAFRHVNASKDTLYSNISASSSRTKKEFRRLMTLNYVCILMIVLVEILFVLINPALAEWFADNIGGTVLMWSILMLFMNLIGIYIPIHTIVSNVRAAWEISRKGKKRTVQNEFRRPTLSDMFMLSSNNMVSMMFSLTILVIVPNNLGIWEHLIVMLIILVGLFYYNRKTVQKVFESASAKLYEPKSRPSKRDKPKEEEKPAEEKQTQVSINVGNRKD